MSKQQLQVEQWEGREERKPPTTQWGMGVRGREL